MIYSNGNKYEGEWFYDEIKGKGIFTYNKGLKEKFEG